MTLQELITDLKAAGANENTVRLAMNAYELGVEKAAEICDIMHDNDNDNCAEAAYEIRLLKKETK